MVRLVLIVGLLSLARCGKPASGPIAQIHFKFPTSITRIAARFQRLKERSHGLELCIGTSGDCFLVPTQSWSTGASSPLPAEAPKVEISGRITGTLERQRRVILRASKKVDRSSAEIDLRFEMNGSVEQIDRLQ